MTIRKLLTTGAIAALVGAAAFAATSTAASARTVCNAEGDCWHESSQYDYPATLGVRFYGDDYRTTHHDMERANDADHAKDHYTWREDHEGRGYYRQGVWVAF
jgi:phosphate-selective porin